MIRNSRSLAECMRTPEHGSASVMRGLLVSDFNIENLSAYLKNGSDEPQVDCEVAPYGQVTQVLLDGTLPFWEPAPDFLVVWTRPEAVLEGFAGALSGLAVDLETIRSQVDDYCRMLLGAKGRARIVFVPTWVVPTLHQGHGILDLAREGGVGRLLMEANLRLLEVLDDASNLIPLNASKWVELVGQKAFNPRLWYLGKVPFGNELFKAAVRDLKAALRGIQGRARKLVILDLDDTLWGGIVGEVGWRDLVLGGHDPAGEALVDFQRELKALARRGVVLAIVSKNEESVAIEAIREHPEMVLRTDDFAAWRINWKDKAQNIADLAADLNLGLDATVFIDDNPVERARVRETLPEVLVPDWPDDKRLYPHSLLSLDCFDKPAISEEDRQRAQMYRTERQRTELKTEVGSVEEWLKTLGMAVSVEPLNTANLGRLTQLLNKTNQMNLSTRRMTESELLAWVDAANRRLWGFHVTDKFGESGLTGILSLEAEGGRAQVVDFVLSCRVMGRKVEETMLHVAIDWAKSAGVNEVCAPYSATAKNRPCLEFFRRSGFRCLNGDLFVWDAAHAYPLPPAVQLLRKGDRN